ncbi:unnamed protein product [Rotaria sp. Silwood1]|nr:unnamed protein product [Rotaria sp. Silwood1]
MSDVDFLSEPSTDNDGDNDDDDDDYENTTSNTQISTDEDENPTLQEICVLIKQVRRFVSLVRKSSNLHEYVQQQKREKKLSGDIFIFKFIAKFTMSDVDFLSEPSTDDDSDNDDDDDDDDDDENTTSNAQISTDEDESL